MALTKLTQVGGSVMRKWQRLHGEVEGWGAKGDALIAKPNFISSYLFNYEPMINPNATDDTAAIRRAIESESLIVFNGKKGYLVSDCFVWGDSGKTIMGNGCVIVYKGGRKIRGEVDKAPTGIFQPQGFVDSSLKVAEPVSGIATFSNVIKVKTSTSKLSVGSWFLFKADNKVSNFETDVRKYAYYPAQVSKLKVLDGDTTEVTMSYKAGFPYLQSEITLGTFTPAENTNISGFRLVDLMPATKTPDRLPVPQAPVIERQEAVGLVYGRNIVNYVFSDLQSYNGKYSVATAYTSSNGIITNIRNFKPTWFGGGEGYAVRLVTSCYVDTSSLSMLGGRHVIDWTTCGWCNHEAGNGATDQVSFSMHTQCEHDINIKNVVGGDFYLANGAYGLVSTRVTLDNCTFTKVRINCMHLTILNSNLNDFECASFKCTIKNTNITDFSYLNKDTRRGGDAIIGEYAEVGKLTIDSSSGITRKKDYSAGTSISGWYRAKISNRWTSDNEDTRYSLLVTDVASFETDGEYNETNLYITGISRDISTDGCKAKITNQSINAPFVAIASMDIPLGEVQSWRLHNMNLHLNGKMRPFQIVSRSDSKRAYEAIVSGGGSVFKGCLQASITDKGSDGNLTFVGLSYGEDSYDTVLSTQVESKNDMLQYKTGIIYATKGTGGRPAWWDGSTFIDLVTKEDLPPKEV